MMTALFLTSCANVLLGLYLLMFDGEWQFNMALAIWLLLAALVAAKVDRP